MNEYYKTTHFCMSLSTSTDYMREAFEASKAAKGIKDLQWPDDVHLNFDDEENEGYSATVFFNPTDSKTPPNITIEQFMFVCGHVMGNHGNNCHFDINAGAANPRFFYSTGPTQADPHGGFYVDENKIQGEAVMTLNKIRELCR